jgi:cobalt/nickel transport system permease protein
MHLPDGVISPVVTAAGTLVALGGVFMGMRRMGPERVPRVAILTSALFVASLIRIPAGVSSVHLVLNGLAGVILGWALFPALLVALFLQAIMYSHGGLTVLGLNVAILGLPGVAAYYVCNRMLRRFSVRGKSDRLRVFGVGCLAGGGAIGMSCLIQALALLGSDAGYQAAALGGVVLHIPVILIEGAITGYVVLFIRRVRPKMLDLAREPLSTEHQGETD